MQNFSSAKFIEKTKLRNRLKRLNISYYIRFRAPTTMIWSLFVETIFLSRKTKREASNRRYTYSNNNIVWENINFMKNRTVKVNEKHILEKITLEQLYFEWFHFHA